MELHDDWRQGDPVSVFEARSNDQAPHTPRASIDGNGTANTSDQSRSATSISVPPPDFSYFSSLDSANAWKLLAAQWPYVSIETVYVKGMRVDVWVKMAVGRDSRAEIKIQCTGERRDTDNAGDSQTVVFIDWPVSENLAVLKDLLLQASRSQTLESVLTEPVLMAIQKGWKSVQSRASAY